MRIDIISCAPALLESPFGHSIVKRAIDKGLVEIHLHDLHQFPINKHGQIDDYPFGGGGGMVLRAEPLAACIRQLQATVRYDHVLFMTPDGERFSQDLANRFSLCGNLLLICGHFKGIDQRIRDLFVTMDVSIGDYVLTGGELAAAVVVDAIVRLLPGAISDEVSALTDSFQDGLLGAPVYTRPAEWEGMTVPDVLTSGDTPKIEAWRFDKQVEKTTKLRPDLLR
jgi:tRNA (guanine37-N1)-methyltransferase